MANHTEPNRAPDPGKDSTVTDWHGQEVDRDLEAADEALALADGDEGAAEEIFDAIRPDHPSDQFKVPAGERVGTLVTESTESARTDADIGESVGTDDGFQAVDAGAQATRSRGDAPVMGAPSDNTTLIGVLASFEAQGFGGQLIPAENGSVECGACNETSPASDFEVSATRRLEGASDPDDMLTVVGARCPRCDSAGVLILGYGPNASEEDAAISAVLGASAPSPDAHEPSLSADGNAAGANGPTSA